MENAEYIHDLLSNFFKTKTFKAFLVVGILVLIIYNWGVFGTLKLDIILFFFIILFSFYSLGSKLFLQAKVDQNKIIADDNIKHSVIADKKLILNNGFVYFTLGGFDAWFYPKFFGKDGIVKVHKDFIIQNESNIYLNGYALKKKKYTLTFFEYSQIKLTFNYVPSFYYEILPYNNKIIQTQHLKGADQNTTKYFNALVEQLDLYGVYINNLKNHNSQNNETIAKAVTNTLSILKPFSRVFKKNKIDNEDKDK